MDTYHGTNRDSVLRLARNGELEIVITTFEMVSRYHQELYTVAWHVAFFDEAHKLKNHKTKGYAAAALLPTKLRYGLSGTIMQNNFNELYRLLHLLVPDCLGSFDDYTDYYQQPIQKGQSTAASAQQVQLGRERGQELRLLTDQVALRRNKSIIADQLPQKIDMIVFCDLSKTQAAAYNRVLECTDVQLLVRREEECECNSGEIRGKCCYQFAPESDGGVLWPLYHMCDCGNPYDPIFNPTGCKWHKPEGCKKAFRDWGIRTRLRCPNCLMLPVLTLLRKVANHLDLAKADPRDADLRTRDRQLQIAKMVLADDAGQLGGLLQDTNFLSLSSAEHCGKMAAIEQLLPLWAAQRDKVLLFSHSTRMLDILEKFVTRKVGCCIHPARHNLPQLELGLHAHYAVVKHLCNLFWCRTPSSQSPAVGLRASFNHFPIFITTQIISLYDSLL